MQRRCQNCGWTGLEAECNSDRAVLDGISLFDAVWLERRNRTVDFWDDLELERRQDN